MATETIAEMSGTTNPNLPKVKWDDTQLRSSYANNLLDQYEKRFGKLSLDGAKAQ